MGILVIGKPAEFGENSFPVRGQCQPHTRGWNLRYIEGGKEEVLHTDGYYACRQIQKKCQGMGLEEIKKEIESFVDEMSGGMEETQKIAPNDKLIEDPEATPLGIAPLVKEQLAASRGELVSEQGEASAPSADETPEASIAEGESTEVISRDEMEHYMHKRKKDFED
ncbi:MAG: hypothetical protein JXR97_15180 [Planctomycetes bacterium]|nr:hypothetical protein [Planctomycetota bacterium]